MDESRPIWRYLDLAKFITLLTRGLHFTLPTKFGDPWEGAWGTEAVVAFRREYFGRPEEGAREWENRVKRRNQLLEGVGVSCWHASDVESAALWELYMPRGLGVAIQTTARSVREAAQAIGRDIDVIDVSYVDYDITEIPHDLKGLLRHKRSAFQHEREVRFLLPLTSDESTAIGWLQESDGESRDRWISLSPINGGLIRPGRPFSVTDASVLNRATATGVHLSIAAVDVIESVYLAPSVSAQVRYAVLDVAEALGLEKRRIVHSSMSTVPPDRVRFFP